MRILFVFLFVISLGVSLASCTKNKGPVNRYVIMDNYDDFIDFAKSSNEYAGEKYSDF